MKTWKKLALTCTLGMGVFFGVDGMVLPTYHFIPLTYAAEAVPMEDTWIASDGDTQYYLKGGTLQFDRPTYAMMRMMREAGAYSFRAEIISVYPDGSSETHQYYMASKGAIGVSIDGSRIMLVDPDSIYGQIYAVVRDTYII